MTAMSRDNGDFPIPPGTLLASGAKPGFTASAMAHWQGPALSVRWVICRRNSLGLLTRTALDAGLSGLFLLHGQKPIPPMPLSSFITNYKRKSARLSREKLGKMTRSEPSLWCSFQIKELRYAWFMRGTPNGAPWACLMGFWIYLSNDWNIWITCTGLVLIIAWPLILLLRSRD